MSVPFDVHHRHSREVSLCPGLRTSSRFREIPHHPDAAIDCRTRTPTRDVLDPELKERFLASRCIKLGDTHYFQPENFLLVGYIVALEHDTLSRRRLVDVGLPALLDRYIAERLQRGPNVWPIEDTRDDLAVALFGI